MSLINAIGNTPLIDIQRLWDSSATGVRIMVKLEGSNPGGSVKDRPAYFMLKKTILEPTSGNTGIGMAMIAASLGYRIKLTMPACVSEERRSVLMALGAELELTPGCDKTDGAIVRAHSILEKYPDQFYMPNQFENPANCQAHFETTAPELVRDTAGEIDWFVAGMGTTGTLMGCSRYFRKHHPKTKVAGVEPPLNHRIQGLKNMQESIVPAIFEPALIDKRLLCPDEEAFNATRELALREGLFCGISSGAALWGALQIARDLPRGSTIAALLPDRGDRYLSTEVFRSVCALCPP